MEQRLDYKRFSTRELDDKNKRKYSTKASLRLAVKDFCESIGLDKLAFCECYCEDGELEIIVWYIHTIEIFRG